MFSFVFILTRKSLLPSCFGVVVPPALCTMMPVDASYILMWSLLLTRKDLPELFSKGGRLSIMAEVNPNLVGDTKLFALNFLPKISKVHQGPASCTHILVSVQISVVLLLVKKDWGCWRWFPERLRGRLWEQRRKEALPCSTCWCCPLLTHLIGLTPASAVCHSCSWQTWGLVHN